jgi:hypothetical protein
MRWAGHVARMGEKRNACRLLVGKPEGKRPLGRSRRRWVDNIRMDLGQASDQVANHYTDYVTAAVSVRPVKTVPRINFLYFQPRESNWGAT